MKRAIGIAMLIGSLPALVAGAQEPGADFDHTATRFVLTGSHENVPCEGCHAMGVFAGTPTECSFCHDSSGMRAESRKPLDHVPTTNRCQDCHTAVTWTEIRFDHVATQGSCQSCHNGGRATGKPMNHITTTSDCDACHNTFVWDSIRFDHAGVTQSCSTCHNGMDATGKPNDHITTTAECDQCHGTRRWSPASFDHSNVSEPCSSCHNGMDATGKDNDHITTSAECDLCHSTRAWRPASFDHGNITEPCSTCHDGTDATGKPDGHFVTPRECDACHRTTAWQPDTFSHMSANYPGDHRQDLDCRACHPGNSETVVYTDDPSLAPDCAGCHRNDFRRDPHKKHENPDTDYTVQELKDCSGSCHIYEDASLSRIKETRTREHRVGDREFDD